MEEFIINLERDVIEICDIIIEDGYKTFSHIKDP
jgi:hypothetical protein